MEEKICPYCGHKMFPRKEHLSMGLVNTLIKFVRAIKQKGFNNIHLQKEMSNLTKNEYNNFQKLRYHGLVHHCKDVEGNVQAGRWLITRIGGRFMRNEIELPKTVYVQNNRIIEKGDEMVRISDYFGSTFDGEYWQREFALDIDQGRLL